MTDESADKRADQLTSAPQSTPEDARARIDVTETENGTRRIDIRDDANARPGKGDDGA
ncbi:multidrug transporter [Microbacteriaceae bacterium VKM Ac-2855]|nr:multidrug transporter [Microbacteriaceae bacterium VKM Ac-2855]